ncbi:LORF2 protein, partial [Crocuta crocuta]
IIQSLWKTVWRLLKKLKLETPYDSIIPLLSIYPKPKTLIQKDTCIPMFIAALFTIAKTRKQAKCPSVDKWIRKTGISTIEYYTGILKKDEIVPFHTTWMDLQGIMLSDISQTEINTH